MINEGKERYELQDDTNDSCFFDLLASGMLSGSSRREWIQERDVAIFFTTATVGLLGSLAASLSSMWRPEISSDWVVRKLARLFKARRSRVCSLSLCSSSSSCEAV